MIISICDACGKREKAGDGNFDVLRSVDGGKVCDECFQSDKCGRGEAWWRRLYDNRQYMRRLFRRTFRDGFFCEPKDGE